LSINVNNLKDSETGFDHGFVYKLLRAQK